MVTLWYWQDDEHIGPDIGRLLQTDQCVMPDVSQIKSDMQYRLQRTEALKDTALP